MTHEKFDFRGILNFNVQTGSWSDQILNPDPDPDGPYFETRSDGEHQGPVGYGSETVFKATAGLFEEGFFLKSNLFRFSMHYFFNHLFYNNDNEKEI